MITKVSPTIFGNYTKYQDKNEKKGLTKSVNVTLLVSLVVSVVLF